MGNWTEDPAERRMFNDHVARVFDGSPLRAMAAALGIYSRAAPSTGSYGKTLKIYSNEAARAAEEITTLHAQLSTADAERREMVELMREAAAIFSSSGDPSRQILSDKLRQAADRADGGRG